MRKGAHEKRRRDEEITQPEELIEELPRRSYRTGIALASTLLILLLMLLAAGFIYLKTILKAPTGKSGASSGSSQTQQAGDAEGQEPILTGSADRKENVFTMLVIGLDKSEKLSDTIIAATFDLNNKSVAVLNIPRDTLSSHNGGRIHKINAAYAMGGIERTIEEVQNVIGYEIDRHVIVTCDAFVSLIDAIGGVDYEIPKDMYKVTDDMIIDLKAGYQHLDGEHALMYMRYRGYANADLARIQAQQGFYKAVLSKIAQPSTVFKLPSLVSIVRDKVDTDLTLGEMLWIGMNFYTMDAGSMITNTLPNTPKYIGGASYVVPREQAILELVNAYYNPCVSPVTALTLTPVPDDAEEAWQDAHGQEGEGGEDGGDDPSGSDDPPPQDVFGGSDTQDWIDTWDGWSLLNPDDSE